MIHPSVPAEGEAAVEARWVLPMAAMAAAAVVLL
jgi:hypothetical protein